MPTTLHLMPAAGLLVRDPHTRQPLPPEGAVVQDDSYWHRRLRDGDVAEVVDLQPAASAAVRSPVKPPKKTTERTAP